MDTLPLYQTTGFKTFIFVYVIIGVSLAIYYWYKKPKKEETFATIGKMFVIYLFPPAAYFLLKSKQQ